MLHILYKVSILGILPSLIVCFSGLLVYLIRECTFMEEKHAMVRSGKGML